MLWNSRAYEIKLQYTEVMASISETDFKSWEFVQSSLQIKQFSFRIKKGSVLHFTLLF